MERDTLDIYSVDARTLVKDLGFATLYYISELDILESVYQENCFVDQKEAMMVVEASRDFNNVTNKYILATGLSDFINFSPEARIVFASELKHDIHLKKMAIHINSLAYRILSNFFIRFNKPPIPTKVFNDRKEAINWLLAT